MLREGQVRIPSGCAISGIFSRSGQRIPGDRIVRSISAMHDRSNGLGGGFAGYGIYPEFSECYAFHLFYDDETAKAQCEALINQRFEIASMSKIPTRKQDNIHDAPLIWRYFVLPRKVPLDESELDEAEYVVRFVLRINSTIPGAYVFSSGKNMGVFKAVGFPEDVGEFYRLEEYEGYCWTAHGRYPTNTPGWWGGAHPFALLDYSVVHNGEISSYDANRRFIEMFGYACTLQTDTEAIAVLPKPISRASFSSALHLLRASHSRLLQMQEQARKLRKQLEELRLVSRAKCILIETGGLTEPEAHAFLEKQAMNRRMTKVDVARELIQARE